MWDQNEIEAIKPNNIPDFRVGLSRSLKKHNIKRGAKTMDNIHGPWSGRFTGHKAAMPAMSPPLQEVKRDVK
jgi:hypothetical protein